MSGKRGLWNLQCSLINIIMSILHKYVILISLIIYLNHNYISDGYMELMEEGILELMALSAYNRSLTQTILTQTDLKL